MNSIADVGRRNCLKIMGTSVIAGLCMPLRAQTNFAFESRAILDEGLHWVTKSGAEALCKRIHNAGFNVFVPCVWHGRGVSWPSKFAHWDDRLRELITKSPHYDPLGNLLKVASKYDIEVHPWFTVGHVEPEFAQIIRGASNAKPGDFYDSEFRTFISSVILEVVDRYPIHGINLDYVRFDSPRAGYELEREQLIAAFIRDVADKSRMINPSIVVSVDAAPWSPTIKQFGQDSVKWAEEGIVDVIYSMQYQPHPDFAVAEKARASMKRPEAFVVMVGNYDYNEVLKKVVPRDPDLLINLIERSRQVGPGNGIAVYLYGQMSDAQVLLLRDTVFSVPSKTRWVRSKGIGLS